MTVTPLKRDARAVASSDKAREPDRDASAQFGKLLKKRRGAAGSDGDEALRADGPQPSLPWLAGLCRPALAARDGAEAARAATPALLRAVVEEPAFPAGVETTVQMGRSAGAELHLRFTNGAWAGLEMQAALHAGEVVVKLRPANRLQHRRLTEASASLTGRLREQTGEAVQLEIADATR